MHIVCCDLQSLPTLGVVVLDPEIVTGDWWGLAFCTLYAGFHGLASMLADAGCIVTWLKLLGPYVRIQRHRGRGPKLFLY